MTDKERENDLIEAAFAETDRRTGQVVNLTPNNNNTVQPVALMRLGLFVPTLKSTSHRKNNAISSMDVTSELKQLSIVKSEGYENIKITGARLDMDNDFKTWVGIIHAFAKHKVLDSKVTLPFVDFVKLCGIPSARSSQKLRDRLEASLARIATNTLQFSNKEGELYVTHLVQSAKYSVKNDTVEIQADPKIFELYQFDKKVLLQLRAINELARKESAQALYTYIESLPSDPAPISMSRLRARLNLTSRPITQNATVRRAMEQLKNIGYLEYSEVTRGKVVYFIIHNRNPKLKPASLPFSLADDMELDLVLDDIDDASDSTTQPGEMVMLSKAELKLLEKIRKARGK